MPNVCATKTKPEGLQAKGLIGNVSGKNHQVCPRNLVAVFLLDWPQQSSGLVQVYVVWPRVQWSKSLVAGSTATATVCCSVGAGCMPCQSDHQPAVVAPVRWPPGLAVNHESVKVLLQGFNIQFLELFVVVEAWSKGVCLGVVLVQDVKI